MIAPEAASIGPVEGWEMARAILIGVAGTGLEKRARTARTAGIESGAR